MMLACRVSVSLSVFLVFILIPSTGFAQTCERDGGQCTEKKVEDCGCSKLVRPPRTAGGGAAMTSGVMPPDSQDVPVAVPLDSRPRSTDDETPGEENDKREDEPKQSKSPTVENTDDKTQTSKDEKPQSAKMKYIPASEAKSPYPRTNQMSCLPGGLFYMGTDEVFIADDGEQPSRPVHLRPFCIDVHEVSIAEFELFVNSTGYVSYAERMGDSFVVEYYVSNETKAEIRKVVLDLPWWLPLKNTSWKNPEGSDSNVTHRKSEAMVHAAYSDAQAYCKWAGKRLPTEAEWEYACRGGLHDRLFPWGNLQQPRGEHRLNIWQGKFPRENTAEDGHAGVAPVTEFLSQNKFGLKNMVGNVWEWVADYFESDSSSHKEDNPTGPTKGFDRVKKGGSFLCSIGYCYRFRCAARSSNSPDTTAYNLGFRCASDKLPDYIPPYDFKAVLAEEEEIRKAGNVIKTPDDWVEKVKRSEQLATPGHK